MPRSLDDLPYRAMRELCVVVSQEMARDRAHDRAEHIAEYHLPTPQHGPLRAAPWAKDRIPDVELAKMQEAVEAEGLTLPELSERFGKPPSLIMRELKAYQRRHAGWVNQYAWASDLIEQGA